jgi:hypothetical protein
LFPKLDARALFAEVDSWALFPKPIDVSAFIPKIDVSAFISPVDLSTLFTGVDSTLLLPTLDASALFPTVDLQSLIAQVGASTLPTATDQDGSLEADADEQSTVPSRRAAAVATSFVFFIVFIGLTLMIQDFSQIAKLSQLTGASPFDIAMGFGALTFWVTYSRRNS